MATIKTTDINGAEVLIETERTGAYGINIGELVRWKKNSSIFRITKIINRFAMKDNSTGLGYVDVTEENKNLIDTRFSTIHTFGVMVAKGKYFKAPYYNGEKQEKELYVNYPNRFEKLTESWMASDKRKYERRDANLRNVFNQAKKLREAPDAEKLKTLGDLLLESISGEQLKPEEDKRKLLI